MFCGEVEVCYGEIESVIEEKVGADAGKRLKNCTRNLLTSLILLIFAYQPLNF